MRGEYEAYLFLGLLNQICYKTKMYNVKCNFYNKERIFNPNPNHTFHLYVYKIIGIQSALFEELALSSANSD